MLSRPVDISACPIRCSRCIVQHRGVAGPVIPFSWHGGEPTVLGLDYFRRIVARQARHRPRPRIVNGVQRTGSCSTRLVPVSRGRRVRRRLSLDGPPDLHDCYQVDRGHQPTHARVMRA
jgi:uncharacterized protein